ncbi:MAG: hypothetical protein K8F62_04845, partial [Pseudorhodoplanes sp.]|nr:hypothetical protein [Pseudorhodoplanes sp.]
MALSSMTGFARSHGASGTYAWSWELKSVNAKGLELRLRIPPGWDAIEVPARAKAAETLSRGHRADEDRMIIGIGAQARAVAQERAARTARRGIDGDNADALAKRAPAPDQRADERRFADAGRAGDADDVAVRGARRRP